MPYSALPVEVRLDIVRCLDAADLKILRLVDKSCSATASKRLFHTVELWPMGWSWRRLEAMSSSPYIQDHVETLHVRTNILRTRYMDKATGWSQFKQLVTRRCDPEDAPPNEKIDELYTKYKSYVVEQVDFETVNTAVFLHALRRFSNLKTIICKRSAVGLFDKETNFLPRASNIAQTIDERENFGWDALFDHFYGASMNLTLRSLTLSSLGWRHFPDTDDRVDDGLTQSSIHSGQMALELHLSNGELIVNTRNQAKYLARLNSYISQYTNLESLTLSFGTNDFLYNYVEILLRVPASLANLRLARLRHLALSNVFTTENSLVQLLQNHSATLRSLHLSQIGVGLPRNTLVRESVLSLFWRIEQVTNLEKVTLTGLFTNLVDEAWKVVEEKVVGDCYCAQLQDFMTHRREWPTREIIQDYLRLKDTRMGTNQEQPAPVWEDDSWRWMGDFISKCKAVVLLNSRMQ